MKTKYWNKVRLLKVIYYQPPARFCSCDPSPTVSSQTSLSRGLEKTGLESGSSCPGVGSLPRWVYPWRNGKILLHIIATLHMM